MKIILLIMIGVSILNADFTRSGDTVTDSISKLEWQDNEIGTSTSWTSALERCESLVLSGSSDWRLPNVNELKSIVDKSKYDPSIIASFQNTYSYLYWSSTSYEGGSGNAWYVNFNLGNVSYDYKSTSGYVRCVRGGQ